MNFPDKQHPAPPPNSEKDSLNRTVVENQLIEIGSEVSIRGLAETENLNGECGTVTGREGTAYFIHIFSESGGREEMIERHNLELLETTTKRREPNIKEVYEGTVSAVRVLGIQKPHISMNGLYRRTGISGHKFEQRLTDGSGNHILWKDTRDNRWKIAEGTTSAGWQPSYNKLLGQWLEDPKAEDGTSISGKPYPFICVASAAEHCYARR